MLKKQPSTANECVDEGQAKGTEKRIQKATKKQPKANEENDDERKPRTGKVGKETKLGLTRIRISRGNGLLMYQWSRAQEEAMLFCFAFALLCYVLDLHATANERSRARYAARTI